MWAITVIGITAVATLFILAKEGRLGPMPSFEELENPKTNLATEVYSADGKLLGNYFIENRTYLAYEDLFPEDRSKWLTLDGHQLPPRRGSPIGYGGLALLRPLGNRLYRHGTCRHQNHTHEPK